MTTIFSRFRNRFKAMIASIIYGPSMATLRGEMQKEYITLIDALDASQSLEDTKRVYIFIQRFMKLYADVPECHDHYCRLMVSLRLRQDKLILHCTTPANV